MTEQDVERVARAIFEHEQSRPFPPTLTNIALYGQGRVTWDFINSEQFVRTCSEVYREKAKAALSAMPDKHEKEMTMDCNLERAHQIMETERRIIERNENNPASLSSLMNNDDAQIASMKLHAAPVDAQDGGVNKHEKVVKDAMRYQYLRNADVDAIHKGGIFAGKTPENVVINGEDLDEAIDKALATVDEMMVE